MINDIYITVDVIIHKDQNGYNSPEDFNRIAQLVQEEIFREYFEDENRDKNKENVGKSNNGYSNLPFNQRQRIDQFAADELLTFDVPSQSYPLPTDLYIIEQDGLTTKTGKVVTEQERHQIGYAAQSMGRPTMQYPVYERYNSFIRVYPATQITEILCRYLRKPKIPKWTYVEVNGKPFFDPSATDYQDFELHSSEFANIVVRILSYMGVHMREQEVIQVAETLKDKIEFKDEQ